MKVVFVASHPIQYLSPLFRALATRCDFEVWFAHNQTATGQAEAGYGVAFDWDVDLLSGYSHHFLENVARRPSVSRFGGCDTPRLAFELAEARPEALVLGGWMLKTYWQALRAGRRLAIPAFVRTDSRWGLTDGTFKTAAKRLAYPPLLRLATGFLAAGRDSMGYLRDLGVPEERVAIVPHTVDLARFSGRRTALSAPTEFHGEGRPVIGFVGRLISLKRVADLLYATASLQDPRPTLIVVGDGPERPALEKLARSLSLDCAFAGFRNQGDLPELYREIDVLALPSDSETWGLVVNEALAGGCSVVVSNAAGCAADLGAFGPAVTVYPVGDVKELATALRESLRSRLAGKDAAARARAVATFTPEAAAEALLSALSRRPE